MRKMTKTAVTLAAMSAMTVATASMAFAAEKQEPNISSIAREEEAVNTSAVGEWSGDDVKGWKFTKEDGTKLKDQWAQIDGVWYYFEGETILQDSFRVLDDKGYFFDETGRLATGWQKITSKMDAYSDINIADDLYNPAANGYTQVDPNHEYDYHDFVWCYFDESGVAKENEWFQAPSGLWYFFDGNVMVKNVYDYWVNPDNYDAATSDAKRLYGFDEDGAMLVGWNSRDLDTTWNNPTADDSGKVWYYYKTNGQMQKAGWMWLDGNWYLFGSQNADRVIEDNDTNWHKGGYPLIVNSYVKSSNGSKNEYFYVNKKGELVSGVQTIKDFYRVTFYTNTNNNEQVDVSWQLAKVDDSITINFSDKKYAAKEGIEGNRYFNLTNKDIIKTSLNTVNGTNYIYDMTGSASKLNFSQVTNKQYLLDGEVWNFKVPGTDVNELTDVIVYYFAGNNNLRAISNGIVLEKNDVVIKAVNDAETSKTAYKDAKSEYEAKENDWIKAQKDENGEYPSVTTISVSGYENITSWTAADLGYTEEIMPDVPGSEPVTPSAARITRANDSQDIISLEKELTNLLAFANEDEVPEIEAALEAVRAAREMIENEIATVADIEAIKERYQAALTKLREKEVALNAAEDEVRRLAGIYPVDDSELTDNEEDFAVKGELVTNAFIEYSKNVYLADKNGNFITNKAILLSQSGDIQLDNSGVTYENLYILFGNDGKAIKGYEGTKKTIVIGGISYWSTDRTVKFGDAEVTVFVSNRQIQNKR